jgi:flagellar hook-basal body complex protein FliE
MKEIMIGALDPKLQLPEIRRPRPAAEGQGGPAFGELLRDAIHTASELQRQSDQEIQRLMTGESQDLHSTMIAVQKADVSFQMMMQVRNKLVQAYQEIMRMPV